MYSTRTNEWSTNIHVETCMENATKMIKLCSEFKAFTIIMESSDHQSFVFYVRNSPGEMKEPDEDSRNEWEEEHLENGKKRKIGVQRTRVMFWKGKEKETEIDHKPTEQTVCENGKPKKRGIWKKKSVEGTDVYYLVRNDRNRQPFKTRLLEVKAKTAFGSLKRALDEQLQKTAPSHMSLRSDSEAPATIRLVQREPSTPCEVPEINTVKLVNRCLPPCNCSVCERAKILQHSMYYSHRHSRY
ncbi:hypothetical protein BDQ17DRAFT_1343020 [Cyathus striatus]|nr:hypothetical protein BDQ17DRAFT_1343020 [Cyathus striatus]